METNQKKTRKQKILFSCALMGLGEAQHTAKKWTNWKKWATFSSEVGKKISESSEFSEMFFTAVKEVMEHFEKNGYIPGNSEFCGWDGEFNSNATEYYYSLFAAIQEIFKGWNFTTDYFYYCCHSLAFEFVQHGKKFKEIYEICESFEGYYPD